MPPDRRRLLALWAVLAVVAVSAGAVAALGERGAGPRAVAGVAESPQPQATAEPEEERPDAAVTPAPAEPEEKKAKPRRPRMPTGTGARARVRRAELQGEITRRQARRWRADLARARGAAGRLTGARGAELRSVLATVDGLAASGGLTVSRMPLAFLTLRRNASVWRFKPMPYSGQRMTFGRDPAVFQYFPGRGMQYHALGTAGRANALAVPCLAQAQRRLAKAEAKAARRASRRQTGNRRKVKPEARVRSAGRCRPRTLEKRLDRLVALASSRGGYTAWESLYAYGQGGPLWVSAMTQATAAQALARGAVALGEPRYQEAALSALGAFEKPSPVGVTAGSELLMYSFAPSLRIVNGFLQSVIGLHDVADLTGSTRARRLYRRGERAVRASLAGYDTGAWSRYSYGGRESSLHYHQLTKGFLQGLCTRLGTPDYCDAAQRFARYEREPPRIDLDLPPLQEARPAAAEIFLSKISDVRVRVVDERGVLLDRAVRLPRGEHRFPFTPRIPGDHAIRITAKGPSGPTGQVRSRLAASADPVRLARERAARRKARREKRKAERQERRKAERLEKEKAEAPVKRVRPVSP